jgi:hypothetical protein
MSAARQVRRPCAQGVSPRDPSENVIALVGTQARFQNNLDAAAARYAAAELAWIIKYFEAL